VTYTFVFNRRQIDYLEDLVRQGRVQYFHVINENQPPYDYYITVIECSEREAFLLEFI